MISVISHMCDTFEIVEYDELPVVNYENGEPLSQLEMLYTVFEDHYDEASVDAVYLMSGCQFDTAFEMLMLPFSGTCETQVPDVTDVTKVSVAPKPTVRKCRCGQPTSAPDKAMCTVCFKEHRMASESKPTTEFSLASFIVPDKRNRKGNRKHKGGK